MFLKESKIYYLSPEENGISNLNNMLCQKPSELMRNKSFQNKLRRFLMSYSTKMRSQRNLRILQIMSNLTKLSTEMS